MSERHNHLGGFSDGCPECSLLTGIMIEVGDTKRLSNLSAFALVRECVEAGLCDDNRVAELMSRVCPGWENMGVPSRRTTPPCDTGNLQV